MHFQKWQWHRWVKKKTLDKTIYKDAACSLSHFQLFATPWTVAHQAPRSTGFSRQEYWGGLPFPSPGNCPDPEIKSTSHVSPALAGRVFSTEPAGKPLRCLLSHQKKPGVIVLIPGHVDPGAKGSIRDRKGCYITVKGPIYREDVTVLRNTASK